MDCILIDCRFSEICILHFNDLYPNLNQPEIKKVIDEFGTNLGEADIGLFFYANHGNLPHWRVIFISENNLSGTNQ